MPHSSGGGSHGGGSHGGSHSYSGGSRSSGSSGSSTPTISRTYYPGASRYIYTGRNGRTRVLYSSKVPSKPNTSTTITVAVILTAIAVGILSLLLKASVFQPKKLDASRYNSGVVIEDRLEMVEDRKELQREMQAFLDKTGVSPAVLVVADGDWQTWYNDLVTYAYTEYLARFDDECHWLFVISVHDDYKTAAFVNWQWEGMLGDDTDGVISAASEDRFTQIMHKHMVRNPGTALTNAFAEFNAEVMEPQKDTEMYPVICVGALVYVIIMLALFANLKNEKMLYESVPDSKNASAAPAATEKKPKKHKCEYCGGTYTEEDGSFCPHCGAPVPENTD